MSLVQAGTEVAVMLEGEDRVLTGRPGHPVCLTHPAREKKGAELE